MVYGYRGSAAGARTEPAEPRPDPRAHNRVGRCTIVLNYMQAILNLVHGGHHVAQDGWPERAPGITTVSGRGGLHAVRHHLTAREPSAPTERA